MTVHSIIGPPGTGKTTRLAREVGRAVEARGPADVVVCSLTKTAAHEIASRVDLPKGNVGTLHSLCYRALDSPDIAETPEVIRAFNEQHPAHRRTVTQGGDGDQVPAGATGTAADRHHNEAQLARAGLIPEARWRASVRDYHRVWTDFKRTEGLRDFTDLISECAEHGIGRAPAALLVDEAQDMSRLELQVIAATARSAGTTVLAGDPAQALYAWRGADPDALLRIPSQRRVLETSWRCGQLVIDRARSLLRRTQPELDVEYHAMAGHRGRVLRAACSWRDPAGLLRLIREYEQHGTVMVVATCDYLLGPVAKRLREHAVPFCNPYRPKNPAWNPMRGAGALGALLRPDEVTWGERARLWTWADVQAWSEPLARRALVRGGWDLVRHKNTRDQFGQSAADETADFGVLGDILGDPQHPLIVAPTRAQADWWEAHLRRPAGLRLPLQVWRRDPAGLLAAPRVILGTAHSVKGGAADTVIVLPDMSRSARWGGDQRSAARALYVAMTRARGTLLLAGQGSPEAVAL